MKKTVLISIFTAGILFNDLSAQVVLQSDFETWTGVQAVSGWNGSATNITTATGDSAKIDSIGAYHGTYCVKLVNASASAKRFSTQPLAVTAGNVYNIRFWAKGAGSIRTGLDGVKPSTGFGYEYNSYIAVNSTTWQVYNQSLLADSTNANAQFLFSVKSTLAASGHLAIDSVSITVTGTAQNESLYNVQFTTSSPANSPFMNKYITTGGIVTAVYTGTTVPTSQSGYYVQTSGSSAWAAVNVYDFSHAVAQGDSVTFSGFVQEWYNETEIIQVVNFTKVSSGNPLPAPTLVGLTTIQNEKYEGMLVKVKDASEVRYNSTGGWYVFSDSTGGIDTVDKVFYKYTFTQGKKYNVTGIVHFNYANWLEPRNINDIDSINVYNSVQDYENNFAEMNIYPNPSLGVFTVAINATSDKNRSDIELTDVTGRLIYQEQVDIHSGKSSMQFDMSGIEKGVYFLRVGNSQGRTVKKIIVQ